MSCQALHAFQTSPLSFSASRHVYSSTQIFEWARLPHASCVHCVCAAASLAVHLNGLVHLWPAFVANRKREHAQFGLPTVISIVVVTGHREHRLIASQQAYLTGANTSACTTQQYPIISPGEEEDSVSLASPNPVWTTTKSMPVI